LASCTSYRYISDGVMVTQTGQASRCIVPLKAPSMASTAYCCCCCSCEWQRKYNVTKNGAHSPSTSPPCHSPFHFIIFAILFVRTPKTKVWAPQMQHAVLRKSGSCCCQLGTCSAIGRVKAQLLWDPNPNADFQSCQVIRDVP
jgi:hypothetical protein